MELIMAPASDSSNEGVANEGGTSSTNGGDVGGGPTTIPLQKGSPPPYDHALYSNYNTANLLAGGQQGGGDLQIASFTNPTPATTSASYVGTTSFTNTFLRGILTSIDSKDPVVANAWLDTLLDAIDLLPPDVIKREIVAIAVSKGQLTNNVASRKSACRLLGKIATKLDAQTLRQDVLPTTLALCQDIDWEVRHAMCRHLALIARGVGHEATKGMIMPQLVELSNDEVSDVRLAAIETVVNLLSVLDDDICTQTIVPLVIKSCDQAKQLEDETLPRLAHHLGRLCHGLMPNLNADHKVWFINFYKHLSGIGVDGKGKITPAPSETGQMPDLVPPIQDKSELFSDCRRECAYNFPAMVIFVGPSSFIESLYSTFAGLAADPVAKVRKTLASSLHELAKLVGTSFNTTKVQIVRLFHDDSVDVLDAMITNMVHVIDALARFGVLQFGQGGQFSADLSAALLHCEATVDRTRNWRLQADCLEKFSCLANCISPVTIQTRFIPLLFDRMKNTRTLPCKIAAARTLLVILRFTVKSDDRTHIHFRIQEELAGGNSCHIRMLYLRLCEMAMALFSKEYFKQQFFGDLVSLSADIVPNVRLKLCTMMPRLKSLLSLPSDKALLQRLEATVKDLLLRETDADVLFALQTSIQDLDGTDTGVDGVPSMNGEDDRDNERKLREERLIASMEEQLFKIHTTTSSTQSSPSKRSSLSQVPLPSMPSNTSPRQRLLPSDSAIKRQQPPRPLQPDLSSLARQTPEPSRTYSPELSVLKNDKNYFFDFSPTTTNNHTNQQCQQPPQMTWPLDPTVHSGGLSQPPRSPKQPYSSSLENLDPSAKEFLVDAGVILDNSNSPLTSASSMPNLAANPPSSPAAFHQNPISSSLSNLEGEFSKYLISNAEMEQYEAEYKRCASIIANGSIEQLANTNPNSPGTDQNNFITAAASAAALAAAAANGMLNTATFTMAGYGNATTESQTPQPSVQPPQFPSTSGIATSSTMTAIPSTPPMGIPRNNHQSRSGSPTKSGSQPGGYPGPTGSPVPPMPPQSYQQVGADLTDNVANFAQSTFSTFSNFLQKPEKLASGSLTSGSSDIQGSIERLAEKWEAKRKSLIAVATNGSFDFEDGTGAVQEVETTEIAKQQRANIMEQKLQAIKQQGIPKKRSLLKTPSKTSLHAGTCSSVTQKRLSLTDQVEAVGQKAVHKFIIEPNQRRKSMEMMINFSASDSEERTSGESSSDELSGGANGMVHPSDHHDHRGSATKMINGGAAGNKFRTGQRQRMHLNDSRSQQPQQPQSLPPYPGSTSSGYSTGSQDSPVPSSSADDSMITYVGASSPNEARSINGYGIASYSSSGSPTHLVVKPVASNPMMAGNPAQRNMMRLPANPPRSLPQPPRSLPMPPTYRQSGPPPASNSLIRAPSTSLLSNRSVYSVNKPNGKSSQQSHVNRQLPQPKQSQQQQLPQPQQGSRGMYYQPVAVLPQTPSPKKSSIPNGKNGSANISNGSSSHNGSKPISPYIVSVNSPPSASPDHSPTSSGHITNSSGSNVSSGSSSSQSSTEGSISTNGPKYTRVPPPRYRPHNQPPLAQRRPVSGGPYQHHPDPQGQRLNQSSSQGHQDMYNQQGQHHRQQRDQQHQPQQQGGNLRQNRYGGKSVSAESVLPVNGRGNGQLAPPKNYDQYGNQAAASPVMKSSSGASSSRSSSPQSSNSESQLTPPDDQRQDQRTNSGNGSSNRVGIPQGPMRRSSGLRMWQGQPGPGQQPRQGPSPGHPPGQASTSSEQGLRRQQSASRSPSPGTNRATSQPRQPQHSGMINPHHKSRVPSGGDSYNSRGSSLPGAYQMNYGRPSNAAGHHSMGGGTKQNLRRPSSLHNSPGTSRPSSPQISIHQKRKSSHYPNSSNNSNASRSHSSQPQQVSNYRHNDGHQGHPPQQHQRPEASRTSLSSMHYSNNAKRQIQQQPSVDSGGGTPPRQQHKQQQFASARTYSNESKLTVGLPTPGFSSRLPMGVSQRSN